MRILITGVAGFTGKYLASELARSGYDVFGLAQAPIQVPNVERVFSADLCDIDGLREVVEIVQPDVVAHLAGVAFVAHGRAEEFYRTNLIGTRTLLEVLVDTGSGSRGVLLASSANVYGNATAGVLTEEAPVAPVNDYAVSKLSMEFVAKLYQARLPLIVARPFNYTGVGQAPNFLIPKIVDHFRRRVPEIELGNIDVARDFSDVRMVVAAYRKLLESPGSVGRTFNVCSGKAYTLMEVIDMASEITGHPIQIKVNPAFVRRNEVKVLLGSCDRLNQTVGTLPSYSLKETLQWMLEHGSPVEPLA